MSGLLLGIDVGGTKIAYALGDLSGALLQRWRRPTEGSGRPREDAARMAEDARRLLREAGADPAELRAIGVSVPGPFDPATGTVMNPPNLAGWQEVPLRSWLEEDLGCPVEIENDANAAALAEWREGAGRGHEHVVYLTMSTGVGGGLVLGGRIHRGLAASAGEVGHAPVEWEGEPCACGLKGCLEAYVGGRAWTARLRRIAPADSQVAALAGGREAARPEHVVEAARAGDAFALAEMDRFNTYLARGIVQLAFTVAPEAVILGTIPVAAGEELCFVPVRERVRAHLWPTLAEGLEILPAALGKDLPYRAGLCVAQSALP